MNALLLEIGCEDLPARYVAPLAIALRDGVFRGLVGSGVLRGSLLDPHRDISESFATPRRIAVIFRDFDLQQPEQLIERSGPSLASAVKDGQPTPAALGFAKTCGVSFAELGEKNGKLHFVRRQPGRATADLLPEIFEETLKAMDELVPKRMRWGSSDETFVRPVQWLLALLGSEVIPLRRFGLDAGRLTYGHRFHAPAAISLASPAEYAERLLAAKVWADADSRKAEIRRQVEVEASKLGGIARISEGLLDEVTALVEWPVVISGRIEERFLELPPEVIVATIETNQRYFTVFDAAGKLLPVFIAISNIESKDLAQVIEGNERVVRPRLSDALFFWHQDLKEPLADYSKKLETVTYQKELGSVREKAQRAGRLAGQIAHLLESERDGVWMFRVAELAKCDLATKMVYELPELQGIMGGYYAAKSGESGAVATAIREHYLPAQAGGPIPSTTEGRIVALADKLDTLAGIFAIGQKPNASKDPFALRRAALGVLRICIEGQIDLDLKDFLNRALRAQPAGRRDEIVLAELWNFFQERLKSYCVERGVTPEVFNAIAAKQLASPADFVRWTNALMSVKDKEEFVHLAAAHKRIRNILKQANVRFALNEAELLLHGVPQEKLLFEAIREAEQRVDIMKGVIPVSASLSAEEWLAMPPEEKYRNTLLSLGSLQEPVDAFFESVMVMADDPALRANRLALLARLDALCREVADISCLPG